MAVRIVLGNNAEIGIRTTDQPVRTDIMYHFVKARDIAMRAAGAQRFRDHMQGLHLALEHISASVIQQQKIYFVAALGQI